MKELIAIQNELKAPKDLHNKFGNYNYRSAESILEALKPLLQKYDCLLTVSDTMIEIGGRVYVKATATIIVGEAIHFCTAYAREEETKKGMDAAQITGSASSYARKYALNGLFLIDDTKDADATNDHKPDPKETKPKETKQEDPKGLIALELGSENFEKCVKYLKEGGLITNIMKKYSLTKEVESALVNQLA